MKIPKELIKEFVKSEDFKSTGALSSKVCNYFYFNEPNIDFRLLL